MKYNHLKKSTHKFKSFSHRISLVKWCSRISFLQVSKSYLYRIRKGPLEGKSGIPKSNCPLTDYWQLWQTVLLFAHIFRSGRDIFDLYCVLFNHISIWSYRQIHWILMKSWWNIKRRNTNLKSKSLESLVRTLNASVSRLRSSESLAK